jgi:hypothetical protein
VTAQSANECLRQLLDDGDPYVRAGALAALRQRGLIDAELLGRMMADEHELVRETAGGAESASTLDKLLALRAIRVFKGLQSVSLMALARASTLQRFAPGDALCVQGEPGQDVLVLLTGQVEVAQRLGTTEQVLRVQRAGEVIGEMSVLDPAPRSATVRALGGGVLALRLAGSAFRDVVATDGEVAGSVIHELVIRLREPATS